MTADILREALGLAMAPAVLLALVAGVIAGVVVGALPGLSATMAVALLVPFTFDLEIMPAMALLIGIYCGAIYGGSIPAILFRTPGTPASAATIFDGYPLARRGEAGRALSIAALAALGGGMIGTVLLLVLTPQISGFALRFGPPEYFGLAVFGLSMIVAVSGGSLLKGLIAAVFGLILATVGMDPLTGYPRFLFGSISLMEGMPFIPAMIGLFAISEVLEGLGLPAIQEKQGKAKVSLTPSKADLRHCGATIVKSGLIGTLVGATPGAGADIAAFLGYSAARQRAKPGERFGDGELMGVAAPEAAKTASTSGAMIPMLALGLPGDSVTAVLIGAFVLHGLQPGPLLFQQHARLAYAIFGTVLLAHILVYFAAISSTRFLLRVMSWNRHLLNAMILLLSLVGAFALRNNLADVWLAIGFGVLGLLLRRGGYPVAPLLLALILGPLAEENFRRALTLSGGELAIFVGRPITLGLLVAAGASVTFGFLKQFRAGRAGKST